MKPVGRTRISQGEMILDLLRLGPATSSQLNAICFRYSARIHELRKAGYHISKKQITEGLWSYTLEGEVGSVDQVRGEDTRQPIALSLFPEGEG